MTALRLAPGVREAMLAHALAQRPNECCGLLAGLDGIATETMPLVNEAVSADRYFAEPRSLFEAFKHLRSTKLDLLAVYHSHPHSEPTPSRRDLADWLYPDQVMVIIGLARESPLVKGWLVTANTVCEVAIA